MTKVFGVAVLLAISFGVGVVTALLIITIGNLASKADVAAQVRIPPLRNERFFGTQRLLAVRVFSSTTNEYPDETLDDMQEAIFCNSSRLDNSTNHSMTVSAAMTSCVTRQFGATSHGQLNYVPASHANLARPGLVELDIGPVPSNVTMNLYNHTYWQAVLVPTMQQALATLLLADNRTTSTTTNSATIDLDAAQVGPTIQSVADRVMYCLPTGSLSQGTGGVAGVGGMFSYYQYGSCAMLQVTMHELGHNLNFHHANVGEVEYADVTGYMGGTLEQRDVVLPDATAGKSQILKAFNGHQHWVSGWFRDRALRLGPSAFASSPTRSLYHRLVSFVDYSHASLFRNDDVVLIHIEQAALYIQYNRAKGYNRDAGMPDTVTVTEGHADNGSTNRRAALRLGESFVMRANETNSTTFDANSRLVIAVCTMSQEAVEGDGIGNNALLDYAGVSINWETESDDGSYTPHHSWACVTAPPSPFHSEWPSSAPSDLPSAMPSTSPSPSASPTGAPILTFAPNARNIQIFAWQHVLAGIKQWPDDRVTSILCVIILVSLLVAIVASQILWCSVCGCALLPRLSRVLVSSPWAPGSHTGSTSIHSQDESPEEYMASNIYKEKQEEAASDTTLILDDLELAVDSSMVEEEEVLATSAVSNATTLMSGDLE